MKTKLFFAALLLMTVGLQTMWAQGFRVYKSDGTVLQFSLRTDSIVFYEGIGTDQDFGPFTPVNQCISGTWYKTKYESVTFNEDGTTDYIDGATYEFMPYQGSLVIFNSSGAPVQVLRVPRLTSEMLLLATGASPSSFDIYTRTRPVQYITGIELNETQLPLTTNETRQLIAIVTPSDADNKEVVWESSDENIATVDPTGLVAAVGAGACTITCSAADGSGVKAECTVTVVQLVTDITLSETSLSLTTGSNYTLTATIYPETASNPNMKWESSDETVAQVDDQGLVTAVAGGTCIITCSATDGSDVKAECQVIVVQLVTSITLSETYFNIPIDDTKRINATVLPENASNPALSWESSDETVAQVISNGLVVAVSEGYCTIICSATDGSGVYAECLVRVGPISGTTDGHEWVDLGLPSGTLWSTCNVGANSPTAYGDYFAWGETTGYNAGKKKFEWSTYLLCNSSGSTLTKYCNNSSYGYNGFTDDKTELEAEDDAATVNWGENWQIPSITQIKELLNSAYTTTAWTTKSNVNGRLITSKKNNKTIFLPASGLCEGTNLKNQLGSCGYYWSRSLVTDNTRNAYIMDLNSGGYIGTSSGFGRANGMAVRPVRKK